MTNYVHTSSNIKVNFNLKWPLTRGFYLKTINLAPDIWELCLDKSKSTLSFSAKLNRNQASNKVFTLRNKNVRRPKEAHIAQNSKEIKILDRAGEDLKELDQH